MTSYTNHAKAWMYAEESPLNSESEVLRSARLQAQDAGFTPGCIAQGAFLKLVARSSQSKSIILVGTGSVVEALRLIEGLGTRGQLTAVDSSPEGADLIRKTFRQFNDHNGLSLRSVNTRARTYFPRLNPQDYDLIVVAGDDINYQDTFQEAERLLKPHGQMIFTDVMCYRDDQKAGGVMNPANRSPRALLLRQLMTDFQDTDVFDSCLLPIGTGLLLSMKH
ncbi:O-methyltransferase [Bombiscardovia coagulans]|uniref:Methyltransferase n=1 Tax=Bombiscardovia coagulans TaxID=686666 RepID=A0A261ET75_9BIFI|nr:methyltransferase [Bombiscardovia coagulans]OZG50058.1 methyltransferase [Bombiscardovia coagulans]